jgi:hypothetical protein
MVRRRFVAALFVFFALTVTVAARCASASDPPAGEFDGKLHIDVTPYVWLPTINDTLSYSLADVHAPIDPSDLTKTFDTQIGPNSYLTNLNFAAMGELRIRSGIFAVSADIDNANIVNTNAIFVNPSAHFFFPLGLHTQEQVVATSVTVTPSVTVFHNRGSYADILAGARFFTVNANANWQLTTPYGYFQPNGSACRLVRYNAFVFGTDGRIALGKKWSVPFYFDYGPASTSTLETYAGVTYGKTSLVFKYLRYQGASGFVKSLNLGGPVLGYTFHLK